MVSIVLQKGTSRYIFRNNGYLNTVERENGATSLTFAVTKEFGNNLYKELINKGYTRRENNEKKQENRTGTESRI